MSALHTVHHQQQILFVTKLSQTEEVFRCSRRDSPFALNSFHQHRGRRGRKRLPHCVEIVERDMAKTWHRWLKSLFHLLLPRGRNSGQCAAMKRMDRGDDLEPAIVVAKFARQLE